MAAFAVAMAGSLLVGVAQAQVDCSDPDNLCTGDPCIIDAAIEVQSPCVVDFGARALIIDGLVQVPNNGVLDFTAASIAVNDHILGRHTSVIDGDGADVSLNASGNITVGAEINVSARDTNGTISLDAGGNVDLQRSLKARARGATATASGGTVTVEADGTISTSTKSRIIDARGRDTAGGDISLIGQNGVTIRGRVDASGSGGGTVTIDSSLGNVILEHRVESEGDGPSAAGSITITASGAVTFTGISPRPELRARGDSGGIGGSIVIQSNTLTDAVLRAGLLRGAADGGSVDVNCVGNVDINALRVGGTAVGGSADVDAGGSVDIKIIIAHGPDGVAGSVSVVGAGDVTVGTIDADGETAGGCVSVSSTGGDVLIENKVDVAATAGAGGEMSFSTPAGNLTIGVNSNRRFLSTGTTGGVIQGAASGDLTARGEFDATTGGCIGLSAGGTLDTSDAAFDPALGASCPLSCASPSGAFLDTPTELLE